MHPYAHLEAEVHLRDSRIRRDADVAHQARAARRRGPGPRRRGGLLLRLGLALTAVPLLAACGDVEHRADLEPGVRCELDHGRPHAVARVTNHSSKPSTYVVDIDFAVDGRALGTRTAVVEEVAAGASATVRATLDRSVPDGEPTCSVTSVIRVKA